MKFHVGLEVSVESVEFNPGVCFDSGRVVFLFHSEMYLASKVNISDVEQPKINMRNLT